MVLIEIFDENSIFKNSKSSKSLEPRIFQIFYLKVSSLVFAISESEDEKYMELRDGNILEAKKTDIWPNFDKISLSTAKIFKLVIFQ